MLWVTPLTVHTVNCVDAHQLQPITTRLFPSTYISRRWTLSVQQWKINRMRMSETPDIHSFCDFQTDCLDQRISTKRYAKSSVLWTTHSSWLSIMKITWVSFFMFSSFEWNSRSTWEDEQQWRYSLHSSGYSFVELLCTTNYKLGVSEFIYYTIIFLTCPIMVLFYNL